MPLEKLSESVRGKRDEVSGKLGHGKEPDSTDKMPVVPHKVLAADLPFYADSACTQQIDGARICILRPLDPDGFNELEVVPTSRSYRVGQYLSWKLYKDNVWEDCYYRNPNTGQVEHAWTMHVEFAGEVISDQAIEADRQRLQQLEALFEDTKTTVM